MAFNKIQPEQIQMATFFSDSGGLNIEQTDTGVRINVSPNLTGTFNFSGSLLTNTREVFGLGNTGNNKFVVNSGNLLLLGSNVDMGDAFHSHDNVCILANTSQVSGINNVLLNGYGVSFVSGTQQNTAVAGSNITFSTAATGCVVIKDSLTSTSQSATNPQSLYINFESGHFFERGQTYFGTHASFDDSGIFSGNLEVLGSGFLTGQEITTKHYLTGYASGNYTNLYGPQSVGGEKTIVDSMRFQSGFQLPAFTKTGPSAGTTAAPATGALAISGHTLYVYTEGGWAGMAISGVLP